MPIVERIPLGAGLPNHLGAGDEGYKALCTLLGASNRVRRQEIASDQFIKQYLKKARKEPARQERTAARIRQSILAFYGDPDARRKTWRMVLDSEGHPKKGSSYLPSLEHAALRLFDLNLLTESPDRRVLDELGAYYTPEHAEDTWNSPALVALPRLRDEFEGWRSTPAERKTTIIVAAFATATLLDDARLLLWAADLHPEVADEYSFLREKRYVQMNPDAGTEHDQLTTRNSSTQVLAQLRDRALALQEAAKRIVDGPVSSEVFDDIASTYAAVLKLKTPALREHVGDVAKKLLDDFGSFLDEKTKAAAWLAEETEAVLSEWHDVCLGEDGTQPDLIRMACNQAAIALSEKLPAVEMAQSEESKAKEALDQHEVDIAAKSTPSRTDTARQAALSEALSSSRKKVVEAMDDALATLRPTGDSFVTIDSSIGGESISGTADEASEGLTSEESLLRNFNTKTEDSESREEGMSDSIEDTPISHSREGESSEVLAAGQNQQNDGNATSSRPRIEGNPNRETLAILDDDAPIVDGPQTSDVDPGRDDEPKASLDTEVDCLSSIRAGVWHAIGIGRLGLAYHIARLGEEDSEKFHPSSELLAALSLGTRVSGPDDELAIAYGSRVGVLGGLDFSEVERPMRDALNLLLFSATLRPALFSAQNGASIPILRGVKLSGNLTAVHRLAVAVAKHVDNLRTFHLDIHNLSAILDEGVWNDRIASHREEIARWKEGATAFTFLFAGASSVWQHWLGRKGILDELTRLLLAEGSTDLGRVKDILNILGDRKAVHSLIEDTDRKTNRRRGTSISGRALAQLESHLEEPRRLASESLRIIQARPGGSGYLERTVEQLRIVVEQYAPSAMQAVENIDQNESTPMPLKCALASVGRAIDWLIKLFRSDTDTISGIRLSPVQALSDDLLFVTKLKVGGDGEIERSSSPRAVLATLLDTENHATTLTGAFDLRLGQGDLFGADSVYRRMEAEDDPDSDATKTRLDLAIAKNRSILQGRLYELIEKLEQAFVIGEVSDTTRAEMTASIDDVTQRLEEGSTTISAGDAVKAIAAQVEPAHERGVAKIHEQLENHLPKISLDEQELVRDAIDSGDLATLYEQLDCLKRGQPLLSRNAKVGSWLNSFVTAVSSIETELESDSIPAQPEIVRAIAERQDLLNLPFSDLSTAQAKRASNLVELWFRVSQQPTNDLEELIAEFLETLGFTMVYNNAIRARGNSTAEMRTEPLRARELCPTHSFGSDAEGRYTLIFNWSALAREPIVQAITAGDPNAHKIVLHFGYLGQSDRNWLRRWSEEQSSQFITVDSTLVLYLASISENRLKALFECTLPFTCIEPFFTAAGLVPPEAFFGRERERREVTDRYGSCFVYGGRQLGKTSLLQSAQAAFHDPRERQLAKYLDLKYEDIGSAHDADHIWQVLWREFLNLEVIDHGTPVPKGRSRLVDSLAVSIQNWLEAHKEGRILLLLDEADAFLAKDLEGDFRVSARLKGIMDETGRRFKVVLCGLHNVLRNTERANHPLAHFGQPVCVGPLLENGDLEQARSLIREPLAAAGYEFETDNLVTKVLIWTNYYPSLIQIFGQTLLRHLRQIPDRDFPHTITDEDIQAVFSRHHFRDYIRNRFSLTLQLDQRYEVIAYAMAMELQGSLGRLSQGLPNNRIFERVRDYWQEGFDISKREFETLLHEMCGLGVLRRRAEIQKEDRYVFRNPNVLRLLGEADTILDVLYKKRELPEVFEASAFHSQYGGNKRAPYQRGPLTREQETVLNRGGRVTVLCGTKASNLADVDEFLGERVDHGRLKPFDLSTDANALAAMVKRLRPPDRDNYICLTHKDQVWSLFWLKRVDRAIHEVQRGNQLRVVFRADPDQLWDFIKDLPHEYLHVDNELFDWVPTQPWNAAFLRLWCSDLGLHDAGKKIESLIKLTGGWPILLDQYATSEQKSWEARSQELEQYIANHHMDILDALGLGAPDTRRDLAPLLGWEELNQEDVETYAELSEQEHEAQVTADQLHRRLFWASQLGIVQDVDGFNRWNPLIDKLLRADLV